VCFPEIATVTPSNREGERMNATTELEVWTTPDFVEYETPMEVTAYAARMD
jgi:coenzyme PQQ precursor peptide PqqA